LKLHKKVKYFFIFESNRLVSPDKSGLFLFSPLPSLFSGGVALFHHASFSLSLTHNRTVHAYHSRLGININVSGLNLCVFLKGDILWIAVNKDYRLKGSTIGKIVACFVTGRTIYTSLLEKFKN